MQTLDHFGVAGVAWQARLSHSGCWQSQRISQVRVVKPKLANPNLMMQLIKIKKNVKSFKHLKLKGTFKVLK